MIFRVYTPVSLLSLLAIGSSIVVITTRGLRRASNCNAGHHLFGEPIGNRAGTRFAPFSLATRRGFGRQLVTRPRPWR